MKNWTGALGKLLVGEIKNLYDAYGGSRIPYHKIKKYLLESYHRKVSNEKEFSRNDFRTARMKDGESEDIYAVRLTTLFRKAYPGKDVEKSRTLRNKFLETVTPDIAHQTNASTLQAKTLHKIDTNWTQILDLVVALMVNKPSKNYVYSSMTINVPVPETKIAYSSLITQTVPVMPSSPRARRAKICSFCRKFGHLESECRRKSKTCLACGSSEHTHQQCPKSYSNVRTDYYRPSQSYQRFSFQPFYTAIRTPPNQQSQPFVPRPPTPLRSESPQGPMRQIPPQPQTRFAQPSVSDQNASQLQRVPF